MEKKLTVLIIEDLRDELHRYIGFVKALGHVAIGVESLRDALAVLKKTAFDVVLTDMHLGNDSETVEGLAVLKELAEVYANVLPIAMSSDPNVEIADEARKLGALEFLRKPLVTPDEISIAIQMAQDRKRLMDTNRRLTVGPSLPKDILAHCPDGIVISKEHDRLVSVIAKNREIPVVILGETGTGKEEIGKLIHKRRCQREGNIPFVSVNCANLNSDLAVSLLFGHRKGAFSGADRNTIGFVGEADGGILFLDEIHTLTRETQHRLLRVLNDGTYTRLGDTVEMHSTFHVIAASTRDLDDEVDNGAFLLDLRTRLTGIDMHLKPLRERKEDVSLLISLFFARNEVAIQPKEFEQLVERCNQFYWRGNIRQLFKVLNSLIVMSTCNDEPIKAENLPVFKTMLEPGMSENTAAGSAGSAHLLWGDCGLLRDALERDVPLADVMDSVEKIVIAASLNRHRKLTGVYNGLAIGRNTLDVKRKKYNL